MTCPNKNSNEWKALVNKVGETRAMAIWQATGFEAVEIDPNPSETLLDHIAMMVSSNFDYFKESYRNFFKTNNVTNEDEAIKVFYKRVSEHEGKSVENGLIGGKVSLFPLPDFKYIKGRDVSKNTIRHNLNILKQKFGFDFEIIDDSTLPYKGVYTNYGTRKVVINIAHATTDTPLHEYYHPFVRDIKNRNGELYAILAKEVDSSLTGWEQEEAIVEYLGKTIVNQKKTDALSMFLEWLAAQFLRLFPTSPKKITELSTLGDVIDVLSSSAPILIEDETLKEAYQLTSDSVRQFMNRMKNEDSFKDTKISNPKDYIKELVALAASDAFVTNDDMVTYQNSAGDEVTRLTSFIGDTHIGEFSLKRKDKPYSYAEYQVRKLYELRGIDIKEPLQETDQFGRQTSVTFEEMVARVEKVLSQQKRYGKMIHALFNYMLESDPDRKFQAKGLLGKEIKLFYGIDVPDISILPELKPYMQNLETILDQLKLKFQVDPEKRVVGADRIAPEITLISKLLGLGTTADGLVQHNNGELSLFDFKTGEIMSDYSSPIMMAYGKKYDINDSKLNRAKLELVFRALMVKEKFPEARFRDLNVARLSKSGNVKIYKTEIAPYLSMIADYYAEKNPEVHQKLLEAGLLDSAKYGGTPTEIIKVYDKIYGLPLTEQIKVLQQQLNYLTLRYSSDEIEASYTIKQERAAITRALLELQKLPHVDLDEVSEDIGRFTGKLKNFSDISNRQVQTLHKIKIERDKELNAELHTIDTKHKELLEKVITEQHYSDRKVLKFAAKLFAAGTLLYTSPILIPGILFTNYLIDKIGGNPMNIWSFMWTKSTDPARPGWYMNTSDIDTNTGKPLTEAQKEYRKFYRNTLSTLWEDTMHAPIDKVGKRIIPKYEYYGMPKSLPTDFMPRYFMDNGEAREKLGFLGATKASATRNLTNYFTELEYGDETKGGVPIKFYAHTGSAIVVEENHTFHAEKSFGAFVGAMLRKKYYDDLYALAEGTKNSLEMAVSDQGGPQYRHLANWLNDQIYPLFLHRETPDKLMTKEVTVPVTPKIAKILGIPPGDYKINQYRLLKLVKSGLSHVVMGFKLIGATFNGIFITIVNTSQATRKLVARALGVPPEEYDVTAGAVAAGLKDVIDFWKHSMLGRPDKSKIWNLAKLSGFLPENYDYATATQNLLTHSPSMGFSSFAFMFHNFVETYGSLWHLSMMLRSLKLKDKDGKTFTAYDAYDSKGRWIKGSRGQKEVSEGIFQDLTELDGLEWKTIKRAYEKLHGSYREDERIALEASIWGQFFVQFKKFLPAYIKNMYASPYKDITVGQYVLKMQKPDGMPIYKWEEQVMEGRMRVLASAALAGAVPLTKKWNELSKDRKKHLSVLINTFMWMMLAGYFLGPDDDEEDTYAGWRWKRLAEDTSMGMRPLDIFHSLEKPVIALSRISDVYEAFFDYSQGVVTGKRTKGGEIKGSKTLISNLPPFSNWYQMQQMASSMKEDSDYLFGVLPVRAVETMNR